MVKRNSIISIILSVFLAFLAMISSVMPVVASADDSSSSSESSSAPQIEYSNVLDDLKKDKNFDETLYPVVADNYTLSVITVAESENLQLFVYVYQPSYGHKTLIASSINISTDIYNKLQFTNYKLNLLSQDGVFQKYVVEGLMVNSDEIRYYEITSIFRAWDSVIDKDIEPTNDNTIDEVAFAVGKQYKFENISGRIDVSAKDIEFIRITEKYVGFLRLNKTDFPSSPEILADSFDVHFVAFSTDKKIDDLLEADVFYTTQLVHREYSSLDPDPEYKYYDKVEEYAYLKNTDNVEVSGNGWFSNTYNWNTIETAETFSNCEQINYAFDMGVFEVSEVTKLSDETKENIKNCDWVLRFAVTDYDSYTTGSGTLVYYNKYYTIVGAVSILRLEFITDGIPYNLGVVDNKQSGDLNPDNTTELRIEMKEGFEKLMVIVGLVLFLVLYMTFLAPFVNPIISMIIKGALKGILLVIKLVFKILILPLRLLFGLFKR